MSLDILYLLWYFYISKWFLFQSKPSLSCWWKCSKGLIIGCWKLISTIQNRYINENSILCARCETVTMMHVVHLELVRQSSSTSPTNLTSLRIRTSYKILIKRAAKYNLLISIKQKCYEKSCVIKINCKIFLSPYHHHQWFNPIIVSLENLIFNYSMVFIFKSNEIRCALSL